MTREKHLNKVFSAKLKKPYLCQVTLLFSFLYIYTLRTSILYFFLVLDAKKMVDLVHITLLQKPFI